MNYGIALGLTLLGIGFLAGWAARSRCAVEKGPVKFKPPHAVDGQIGDKALPKPVFPAWAKDNKRWHQNGDGKG